MTPVELLCIIFIFAVGGCIGSFLNVVIYRLPRDKSLISPPSSCPSCERPIAFYDNVPLFSWLLLAGKCRHCKAKISVRYFVIELLTALVFLGLFYMYFYSGVRAGIPAFVKGGWVIYVMSIFLVSCLIVSSAIDLELWVIPISVCWFVTGIGFIGSATGGHFIGSEAIGRHFLLPRASAATGSLGAGAVIGLFISYLLIKTGLLKRSYESEHREHSEQNGEPVETEESQYNDRQEMFKEILFLLPVVVFSAVSLAVISRVFSVDIRASFSSDHPILAGFLGSLWGYLVGCGIVWATRIFGTLLFGREAMGLGDVHLMGAAGAIIGPGFVAAAFFIAPFSGLLWALCQMFFRKVRQIPYGPFLSLGIIAVMILHDRILDYWNWMRGY
ncbi:MAG: prepilin peptidase [Planctomycetota bacterium]